MRIQNTEMEFISFDAQDVITTSGGDFTGYYLLTQGFTALAYNAANDGIDLAHTGSPAAGPQTPSKYFVYSPVLAIDNGFKKAEKSFTESEKSSAESYASGKGNYVDATANNSTSYDIIAAWLLSNGFNQ